MVDHVPQRKLVAVLYADVAEYSRLTGEDEVGTHRTLTEFLDAFTHSVMRRGGHVDHFAGDAILSDFPSVIEALACAAEVQRDFAARNAGIPEDRQVRFRIGINLGDLIADRGEVYGDGVNVAARLEALAEPGGICISGTVYDALDDNLPFDYEFLGERQVKNIVKPVRAYHARLEANATLPTPAAPAKARTSIFYLAAAIVVMLTVGVGFLGWLQPWAPEVEPAAVERMALPLPSKPSIAVLPFDNFSGDPGQEYFADGLAEDIITDLSKISALFVVSRNSTFSYKSEAVSLKQVARELGVRYALEGSVRRDGDQVRINAQLIDTSTGGHLWAERYDGSLADIFSLQDKLTRKIVTALAINLTTEDEARQQHRETNNPHAYDVFLQGWDRYHRFTRDDYAAAIPYFKKAVELDPNFALAHAALAGTYLYSRIRDWDGDLGLDDAYSLAQDHLRLAMRDPTPLAHRVASRMHAWKGRYEEAIAEAERSVLLDHNYADGYAMMGMVLIYAGKLEPAIAALKKSMRLDPHYPPGRLWSLGLAYFGSAQFEEAVSWFERARQRNPELAAWPQAAAYAHLDRIEEAQRTLREYRKLRGHSEDLSKIHVDRIMKYYRFDRPSDVERLGSGLVKAGLCCQNRLDSYLDAMGNHP